MRKSRRVRRWLAATMAIVIVTGAAVAVYLWQRDDEAGAVRYLTSTVSTGTVEQTVEADFTLVAAHGDTALRPGVSGVVTALYLSEGATLRSLQKLAVISGRPVFALVSSVPLYEELAYGDTQGNVKALESALKAEGYDHGTVDGYFDASTQAGLLEWQEDNGLDQTGTIDLATFVWVPKGSVVTSVDVGKGSTVGAGTSLATTSFPRAMVAQASVGQADISLLEKGQAAQLTIDGHEETTFSAKIKSIATVSSAQAGAGSSSTSAQYTVTLSVAEVPSWALLGMTGSLSITIAQAADVLVVPTSAIAGTASDAYVRVMIDGQPATRQVETGMATSSLTQIVSGLVEGELVVTGTITNGSSTTRSGSSGAFGLPGMTGGERPQGIRGNGVQSGGMRMNQAGGQ